MNIENRKWLVHHSLGVGGTALIVIFISVLYLDQPIAVFFARPELEKVYYYSREMTNIGYSIHYFMLAFVGIVFSKWIYPKTVYFKTKIDTQQNMQIKKWSFFTVKSLVIIGVPLQIVKLIIGRNRPHASENFYPLNFDAFNRNSHWHSMPSGHAQVLFTVATIALLIWPKQKYLFFTLALLFTLTRVSIHQHFFSDITAGAVIGYLGTLWLCHLWPSKT